MGAPRWLLAGGEDRGGYGAASLLIKALCFVAGDGSGVTDPAYDYTTFPEVAASAADAYAQAGISSPRDELAMAEVHDCFTPTELVLMEDLGLADRGAAWKQVLAGAVGLGGRLPGQPHGGVDAVVHPVR